MARRTTQKTIEVFDDQDPSGLSGVLKSLSPTGTWIIKIFRRTRGGTDEWLSDRALDEVNERMLAADYGIGRYLVRPWETVKMEWGPSKTVHIGDEADGLKTAPVLSPVDSNASMQVQMMQLQMQMQSQAADRQFQMMNQFQTSLMGIMTALITSNKPQDLASIASIFKEMSGGGMGGKMDLTVVKDVLSLAKDFGGEGGGSDPTTSLISAVLSRLPERGPAQQQLPAHTTAAPQQPQSEKPQATVEEKAEANEMNERTAFLLKLKEKAAQGKDHQFWADYIDENPEESGPKWILGIINAYEWDVIYPQLVASDPDLANEPFKTWFENLYKDLTTPDEGASSHA